MNRTQYNEARRLVRQNGKAAIKWMEAEAAKVMDVLLFGQEDDWLAERADIVGYCKRDGLVCNVRHTRPTREYQKGHWMGVAA